MKPSFFTSTLSIAFILCVTSVILMAFYGIKPDSELLSVIVSVISFYLAFRKQDQQPK